MAATHLLLAVLAIVLTASASSNGGGLTTPDAVAGVVGATASGLFNIRPLSIFTGHCNASIARGATIWKPIPGVVDIFFPKVVSFSLVWFSFSLFTCFVLVFFFSFCLSLLSFLLLCIYVMKLILLRSWSVYAYCTASLFFFFLLSRFHFLPGCLPVSCSICPPPPLFALDIIKKREKWERVLEIYLMMR